MAKSNRALTGCGIGCGAFVLFLTLLLTVGYFFIRSSIHSFQYAEQSQKELTLKYGDPEDFKPWMDGSIPASRLETFIRIREKMLPVSETVDAGIDKLDQQINRYEEGEKANFWNILSTVGKGLGVIPEMAEYVRQRNEALLVEDMSLGEYAYLYIVVYYTWLEKPLRDGPRFHIQDENWNIGLRDNDNGDSEEDVYRKRDKDIRRKCRNLTRPMLENWIVNIDANGAGKVTGAWRERVAAALDRLKEDRKYVLWQGELPSQMAASLEPFRDRLNSLYMPMTNPLELMRDFDQ